jgi:hypothetical protein
VAVAAVFAAAGVDEVEVLATLLFAPVFIATLLWGRTMGYAVAAGASLVYLGLRYGDIADSGALRVAVLVAARAACYAVVAHATPSFQHRFASMSVPAADAEDEPEPRHRTSLDSVPALATASAAAGPSGAMGYATEGGSTPSEPGNGDQGGYGEYEDPEEQLAPDDYPAAAEGLTWPELAVPSAGGDEPPMPLAGAWADPPPSEAGWGPPDEEPAWGPEEAPAAWDDVPAPGPDAEELAPAGAGMWDPPVGQAPAAWADPPEPPMAAGPLGVEAPPFDEAAWTPPPPPAVASPVGAAAAAGPVSPGGPSPAGPEAPGPAWGGPDNGQPEPAAARFAGPPAPTVPTGWVDDATVPLGDETIPVGYTGELFVPRELRQPPSFPAGGPLRNGSGRGGNGHTLPDPGGPAGVGAEPPPPALGHPSPPPPGPPGLPGSPGPPPSPEAPPERPRVGSGGPPASPGPPGPASGGVDPETRLWNARYFRDRLTSARDESQRSGSPFSVVMVQVADEPFQPLPYRRQVALLRELGHQFIQARMIDHLVHLPDGAQHWFAVVLPDTDRPGAHLVERRLRSAIASYLRSRGLHLSEVQSASLTSPDDDEVMASVWASLLGTSVG